METAVLSARADQSIREPVLRIEVAVLLAILALGVAVRAWDLPALGLTHFDEGVYALTARGLVDSTQPYRMFPTQAKFSPLVFPALVAAVFEMSGPSDTAAFLVNIVLGSLTIVAVWAIGRAWFGRSAGIAAAALVALNDFHVILSRSVLTDVAFSLAFLLALAAAVRACERQTPGSAVLAGLLVGIAWNTKYHGWLVVVIVALAAGLQVVVRRLPMRDAWRLARTIALIGIVAVLCYLPWVLYVNTQPGGYAALARYQKTMLSRQWLANFEHQALMQWVLDGALTRVSIVAALVSAASVAGRRALSARWLLAGSIAAGAGLLIGGTAVCVVLALCAIPGLIARPARMSADAAIVWFGLWCVITPMYRPFARLVLPFTVATVMLAASRLSPRDAGDREAAGGTSPIGFAIAGGVGLVIVVVALWTSHSLVPPASPDVRQAVAGITAIVPPGDRISVVAEPDVEFYLQLAHRRVDRFEESQGTPAAAYVVSGFYGKRSPRLRSRLEALADQLAPVRTFHVVPALMRLADDVSPDAIPGFERAPDGRFDLTLLRLRPAAAKETGR